FDTGSITVTAPISAPPGYDTLSLLTGVNGSISQNAGATITVLNLLTAGSQGVNLPENNGVAVYSAASLGVVTFTVNGAVLGITPVVIGTVDPGVGFGLGSGIMTSGSNITVTAIS